MKMKLMIKFIWFTLLLSSITLIACTAEGEVEDLDFADEQNSERVEESARSERIEEQCIRPRETEEQEIIEFEPTILELEYMYSFEVDYFFRAYNIEGEFTMFDTLGSRGDVTFDQMNVRMQSEHHTELKEYVYLDESSFIAVSMGRRLEKIYYFEDHRFDTSNCRVIARPVFEREYYPNTVFVYRVNPLPQYRFLNLGDYTDDFTQFNTFKNTPFEVWPYDSTMERGGDYSIPGDQILGSTLGEGWQELSESLDGYVNVEETNLRNLPTEHSQVVRQLTHGEELIIGGYVEGGMEIDGRGRWYYVLSIRSAHGRQVGYIHSSFVTITSEVDDD